MNTKIYFEKGILGFEQCKNFELSDIEDNDFFKILKSKEENDFQMIVMSPLDGIGAEDIDIPSDYEVDVPDNIANDLDIKSHKDVIILTTVTVNSEANKITTNLRAPIIINDKNKKATQIILNTEKFKIKHPIMKG